MDTHLFIPVAGFDEVVAVPLSELPTEAEDVLDILKAEEAPLSVWLDFAKAYLAQVIAKRCNNIVVSTLLYTSSSQACLSYSVSNGVPFNSCCAH